jgi:hypothetical protein
MDIDGLLGVAALLLYWRTALCLLASSVLAIALVHLLPWFSGLQGIAIAALGLFPGVLWDTAASAKRQTSSIAPSAPKTSASVALLTAFVFGAAWGGFSSTSNETMLAGFAFMALPATGWYWHAASTQFQVVSRQRAIGCIAVAAIAYAAAAAILNRAA